MDEQALPGGFVNEVVRVGDTVRRTPPPDPLFVHALLELFERRGWAGAPRFLGHDEQGREVLTFLDGHAAWAQDQPPAVSSPASLARVAELVREFHDLRRGRRWPAIRRWSATTTCHPRTRSTVTPAPG